MSASAVGAEAALAMTRRWGWRKTVKPAEAMNMERRQMVRIAQDECVAVGVGSIELQSN